MWKVKLLLCKKHFLDETIFIVFDDEKSNKYLITENGHLFDDCIVVPYATKPQFI